MTRDSTASLLAADRRHVWHPYAASPSPVPVFPVARAEGVEITLADGRTLIDGMSSWWAAIHGYNHPALNAAVTGQLDQMAHVMFGGLTHRPAVALVERLVALTPAPLQRVFLCDAGSVAVEVAIKLALQYWHASGKAKKHKLLTVRGGYHGDTCGAMSVCDPVNGMHSMFAGFLPQHYFAEVPGCRFESPWDERYIADFRRLIAQHCDELAAVIVEPIVQGAGGMRFYAPAYLERVRALCDEHDVLLICDEIATGFGRTGTMFACEHAKVTPDILCLGKAMTGGYMTLAATLTSDAIAERISRDGGVFMHGPTFMGNPLACAVALANLDLLGSWPWAERIAAIEDHLRTALAPCREFATVADVRVLGAIGVVELAAPVDMARMQPALVERGVWLRPFGRLLYTMPPYVITPAQLTAVTTAMCEVAQDSALLDTAATGV